MKACKKNGFIRIAALLLAMVMLFSACQPTDSSSKEESKSNDKSEVQSSETGTEGNENVGFDVDAANTIRPVTLAPAEGTDFPTEDVLTPIWYEKTKVEPEFVVIPEGQDGVQYFQMQMVAGTVPEIIAANVAGNRPVMEFLKSQNLIREITVEDIYTYMPRTVERAEKYWNGITIEEWVDANRDTTDGKLYYFPQSPMNAMQKYDIEDPTVPYYQSYRPYNWYFRDDILKQIFPEAKTENELRQLYVDNGGTLSFEEVDDVPIKSMEDLYDYLTKVKELNMTVDGKPVTPAQLQSTSDAEAIWWSTVSLYNQHWQGDFIYDFDTFEYFANDPHWKDYLKWFNRFFNEGLIGQETFIQKDDQRDAKVINGEYAVFQEWLPYTEARKTAKDLGREYGYRKVALFIDENSLVNDYQDFSVTDFGLDNSWNSVMISTSLPDEQWAQVLNWIDWNHSLEANDLRDWGTSDFYTGDGMERRFKPEYVDVEKWALYGETGGKDGVYYGLFTDKNNNTSLIGTEKTIYQPTTVYPADISDINNVNIDYYYDLAVRKYFYDMKTFNIKLPKSQVLLDATQAYDQAVEYFNENVRTELGFSQATATEVVKAIVGSVEDFDKSYQSFEEKYLNDEFQAEVVKLRELYLVKAALEKEERVPMN